MSTPVIKHLRTSHGAPPFKWSHLWEPAIVNPANLKSYTIPIFNLRDPYSRAFHLSWLGFFVAFLSWFAFPPLIPDAIKSDLKLSNAQVANSNIVALAATLVIRVLVGPLVDHYGPRKTMASLLILGAIPSGLAGTANSAHTLYVLRFFIGILGATFVPCQAWTSAFFDKNCVGIANALVGGWGNMGGGATFAIMTSLFQSLTDRLGLSPHVAWRAAFAIVPAPILIFVAGLTLLFGQDHPAGKWSERRRTPAAALAAQQGHKIHSNHDRNPLQEKDSKKDLEGATVIVEPVNALIKSTLDIAVNESLTWRTAFKLLASPITWLPALAYLTTFGIELAIDSKMADLLFSLFKTKRPGFDQTTAGYYTSILGFLNLFTRPFGGYLGDVLYRRHSGTNGKKVLTLLCGIIMGASLVGAGFYLQNNRVSGGAQLPVLMGVFSVVAIFSEVGNGANFSLVPHCNPYNNGVMSGLVGSFGNLGGIIFALVLRFQTEVGKAFWIMGVISIILNILVIPISVPAL
ncbi:putative high affinity nitrate transporter [Phlegmacium glaucopus]|nr:putative high affinity nitrate transporter [Phlegmacium glaucopus]